MSQNNVRAKVFGTVLLISSIFILASYQNCAPVNFAQKIPVEIQSTLKLTQPSLVTRTTACIACHAKIDSSLVTDFGYGDPFYLGGDRSVTHTNFEGYDVATFQSPYGSWGASLNSMTIEKNLYIPKANMSLAETLNVVNYARSHFSLPIVNQLTLKEFLLGPFAHRVSGNVLKFKERLIPLHGQDTFHNPNYGLKGNIIEQDYMYIGAPSETDLQNIKNYYPTSLVNTKGSASVFQVGQSGVITGLSIRDGNTSEFITNIDENLGLQTLQCEGDVLIEGTLALKDVQIISNNEGCRLYVNGSVFIVGEIQITGAPLATLQISSSRSVVLGFRFIEDRITRVPAGLRNKYRVYNDPNQEGNQDTETIDDDEAFRNLIISESQNILSSIINEDAGPYRVLYTTPSDTDSTRQIFAYKMTDYDDNVQGANWQDPVNWITNGAPHPAPADWNCKLGDFKPGDTNPCYSGYAQEFMRKSVNYERVLFNAPIVYGRYYGKVKGVIIGEEVLMAIGALNFEYDSIFNDVPTILPLVSDKVFISY